MGGGEIIFKSQLERGVLGKKKLEVRLVLFSHWPGGGGRGYSGKGWCQRKGTRKRAKGGANHPKKRVKPGTYPGEKKKSNCREWNKRRKTQIAREENVLLGQKGLFEKRKRGAPSINRVEGCAWL